MNGNVDDALHQGLNGGVAMPDPAPEDPAQDPAQDPVLLWSPCPFVVQIGPRESCLLTQTTTSAVDQTSTY